MRKIVLALALAPGLVRGGETYPIADVPPALAPAVEKAEAAIGSLLQRLSGRLLAELRQGGPARALAVCREEAPGLTAQAAGDSGVKLGRTSHRLRNPENRAPAWAEALVAAAAGKKASEVGTTVVDLGDGVGVLRPIGTLPPCTQCHGAADRLAPGIAGLLREAYPQDRAVGFAEGDLRGFFWAEVR
jgi:hypothetical protein